MTTANKITVIRILLIPVFVLFAVYYADSIRAGRPEEGWRWAAVAAFVVAALSDGLDGYIARRYHQQTRLGVILDPIADKGLVLAALITLSVTAWPGKFPLWFPTLVIARDAITVAGAFLVHHLAGDVTIRPHWTGKLATFFTLLAIAWVMLQIPLLPAIYPTIAAGLFVLASGFLYVTEGIRQIHASGHADPNSPHER